MTDENMLALFRANPVPDPDTVFETVFAGAKFAFDMSEYGFASGDVEEVDAGTDPLVKEARMMPVVTADDRMYRVWVEDLGHHPEWGFKEGEEDAEEPGA